MKSHWAILALVSLLSSALPALAQEIAPPKFILEDGTPVKLVLNETISSADQHNGELISFLVAEEVKLGGLVVIEKGANAWGTITTVKPKGRMGHAGEINVTVDRVRLADGEKIWLSANKGAAGDSHQNQMVGAMVVSGALMWPLAPVFLLMHGKDVIVREGTQAMAFVLGDDALDPNKFTPEAIATENNVFAASTSTAAAPASPASATPTVAATQAVSATPVPDSAQTPASAAGPNTAPVGPEGPGPAPVPDPDGSWGNSDRPQQEPQQGLRNWFASRISAAWRRTIDPRHRLEIPD